MLGDLVLLWQVDTQLQTLPDPRLDTDAWCTYMQANRGRWKNVLRRNWQCYVPDKVQVPVQEAALHPFKCRRCEDRFATEAKRSSHEHRAHKVLSLAGQWAVGRSCCPTCCKQFHASERLAKHFRHNHECLRAVMSFFPSPRVKEDEERQATASRRKEMKQIGRTNEFADLPAWRVSGPSIPRVRALPNEGGRRK